MASEAVKKILEAEALSDKKNADARRQHHKYCIRQIISRYPEEDKRGNFRSRKAAKLLR